MIDFDKTVTDVFDIIAKIAGRLSTGDPKPYPDISGIPIEHLLTDEMMGDPAKFYPEFTDAPEIAFRTVKQLPFVEIREGSFQSPVVTQFPENNTVTVKHFRRTPAKAGRPVVVVLNGLHVDAAFDFYFDWWCLRFVAWGFDCAVVTLPYAQQRTPAGSFSGEYMILPDTRWTLLTVHQSYMDILATVNRLRADGAGTVGMFGVSYGGVLTGICVSFMPGAEFGIMCMPPTDMADLFSKWDFAPMLREREAKGETTLLTDPRVPPVLSLFAMKPRVAKEKVFHAAGKFDHLVPIETVEVMNRAWGDLPWQKIYPTGHINTFALNFRMISDLQRFVRQEIMG